MEAKSVLEMARGAIMERADYEMVKIMDNIVDANTAPNKKRVLTLTLEITPDVERKNLSMKCIAKSKLEPTNPVSTALYLSTDEQGELSVVELTPHAPGQLDLYGDQMPNPVKLKLVQGGNKHDAS